MRKGDVITINFGLKFVDKLGIIEEVTPFGIYVGYYNYNNSLSEDWDLFPFRAIIPL